MCFKEFMKLHFSWRDRHQTRSYVQNFVKMMVKLYDMFPLGNVIVFRNIHDNTLQMLNECFNCHLESLLAHILSKNS